MMFRRQPGTMAKQQSADFKKCLDYEALMI